MQCALFRTWKENFAYPRKYTDLYKYTERERNISKPERFLSLIKNTFLQITQISRYLDVKIFRYQEATEAEQLTTLKTVPNTQTTKLSL